MSAGDFLDASRQLDKVAVGQNAGRRRTQTDGNGSSNGNGAVTYKGNGHSADNAARALEGSAEHGLPQIIDEDADERV